MPLWVEIVSAGRRSRSAPTRRLADHPHDGQRLTDIERRAGLRRGDGPRRRDPGAVALGFALSTTQVFPGAILGAGLGRRLAEVRWGVAGKMAVSWVLTLPAAGITGAVVYAFSTLFGGGVAGPLVIAALLVGGLVALYLARTREGAPVEAV